MRGTYREIQPPGRLVTTECWGAEWPETLNTLVFTEKDRKTTVANTILYPSREACDAALAPGMKDGASASFDRLEKHLQKIVSERHRDPSDERSRISDALPGGNDAATRVDLELQGRWSPSQHRRHSARDSSGHRRPLRTELRKRRHGDRCQRLLPVSVAPRTWHGVSRHPSAVAARAWFVRNGAAAGEDGPGECRH